jgi:general secretion pathway protein N
MSPAKRITIIFSALASVFGGIGIAQKLGLGDGYSLLPSTPKAAESNVLAALDQGDFKLPSWGEYAAVLEHPVFNESREPTPIEESTTAKPEDELKAQPINVTLTSIIMTPKVKLAIVRDNNNGQSTVVKVGASLEGEQSGWKLVEVKPRHAVFEGQGLGRQELELLVDASARAAPMMPGVAPIPPGMPGSNVPPPPLPSPPPGSMATTSDNQSPDANNQARAEEIRKRIEERRKQLREEAERMRSQEKPQ